MDSLYMELLDLEDKYMLEAVGYPHQMVLQ